MRADDLGPGVHLVAADSLDQAWWDDLARRWSVGVIEGGVDRRDVLRRLGRALRFPDYYGQNMDAAWDCLTDLTLPTVVVWHGWQEFAVTRPEAWAGLLGMFHERCALQPDFAVVLAR